MSSRLPRAFPSLSTTSATILRLAPALVGIGPPLIGMKNMGCGAPGSAFSTIVLRGGFRYLGESPDREGRLSSACLSKFHRSWTMATSLFEFINASPANGLPFLAHHTLR